MLHCHEQAEETTPECRQLPQHGDEDEQHPRPQRVAGVLAGLNAHGQRLRPSQLPSAAGGAEADDEAEEPRQKGAQGRHRAWTKKFSTSQHDVTNKQDYHASIEKQRKPRPTFSGIRGQEHQGDRCGSEQDDASAGTMGFAQDLGDCYAVLGYSALFGGQLRACFPSIGDRLAPRLAANMWRLPIDRQASGCAAPRRATGDHRELNGQP
mmetsp:Transcript_17426/g.47620  ORF Transcript_17426/g.47620 Transcript_17426/m.47620 type:complete len:209 (+) Transcript_17426:78-704(+)